MVQIDWNLIERKLEKNLTPEEERFFESWYHADEKNKEYFHKVEKFYRENGFVKEVTDEAVVASWNNFDKRLHKRFKCKASLLWMISSVAACLLVGMILFTLKERKDNIEGEKINSQILAGKVKATLTLSTGMTIDLENKSDEIEDNTAKIINTGSVLNYKREKDSSETNHTIGYNEINTPKGGEYAVVLSDGTKIYLGAFSSLTYPVTFTEEERVVKLSGEAFFNVAHDANHPFIVEMDGMRVKVLGTSFNLRNYADESHIEATLVSGKVRVYSQLDSCILEPDHQALLKRADQLLSVRKVDVEEFVDWKDGKLNIRNQRLEDILSRLGKWYNIHVFFASEKAKDLRFYVNMDRYANLNDVLEKFEKTEAVKFEIKNNVITVFSLD